MRACDLSVCVCLCVPKKLNLESENCRTIISIVSQYSLCYSALFNLASVFINFTIQYLFNDLSEKPFTRSFS